MLKDLLSGFIIVCLLYLQGQVAVNTSILETTILILTLKFTHQARKIFWHAVKDELHTNRQGKQSHYPDKGAHSNIAEKM